MKKLLIIILSLSLVSYSDFGNDNLIYENYCKALDNYGSTYQNYLVVNIQDKSNEKSTEICLTGFELVSTMMDEWNFDIENEFKAVRKLKRNKSRTFKVENNEKHKFLNRIEYSQSELLKYSDRINFDSIVNSISNKNEWSYFAENEKEQVMIAHLLFKQGYLTGINECFGGEQLEYYAEEK
ncbi:hypothetical protein [Winogradskyella forsetii]|uniref:hypothetical protein n=1 Tax=Winogradskyella forsetii TaxID=2686077 RepID=UPI0015BEE86D|nr:hypothetical protein [Winogradskyella forsetii]